jgi:hypothetical protein
MSTAETTQRKKKTKKKRKVKREKRGWSQKRVGDI